MLRHCHCTQCTVRVCAHVKTAFHGLPEFGIEYYCCNSHNPLKLVNFSQLPSVCRTQGTRLLILRILCYPMRELTAWSSSSLRLSHHIVGITISSSAAIKAHLWSLVSSFFPPFCASNRLLNSSHLAASGAQQSLHMAAKICLWLISLSIRLSSL